MVPVGGQIERFGVMGIDNGMKYDVNQEGKMVSKPSPSAAVALCKIAEDMEKEMFEHRRKDRPFIADCLDKYLQQICAIPLTALQESGNSTQPAICKKEPVGGGSSQLCVKCLKDAKNYHTLYEDGC